ncbi:MAG: ribonuclease H-like domain-containing protein [Thermodesulfobacteriota bacterium]
MLKNTFCHISGIGLKTERNLWSQGLLSWDDVLDRGPAGIRWHNGHVLEYRVRDSLEQLLMGNAAYFARALPPGEKWRLYSEFRNETAYLDIETSTGGGNGNYITTIALYDGASVFYYVHGYNLGMFAEEIVKYKLIVTYNGKSFDVPIIEDYFKIKLPQAHIDLRHILHSLGYRGGLKGCERQLGLHRNELDGVNGYYAVLLWRDYLRNGNHRALDTLLAYNILDAVNLEPLMITAYNLKLADTPFAETHQIPLPSAPRNPFKPDVNTIDRLRNEYGLV